MKLGQNENKKEIIIAITLSAVVIFSVIIAIFLFVSSDKTGSKNSEKKYKHQIIKAINQRKKRRNVQKS